VYSGICGNLLAKGGQLRIGWLWLWRGEMSRRDSCGSQLALVLWLIHQNQFDLRALASFGQLAGTGSFSSGMTLRLAVRLALVLGSEI